MIRPEAGPDRLAALELSAKPVSDQVETVTAEPKLAFPRRFQLGQLIATPEAVAAAHAAGIDVVTVVLRHLGGDWGDVDPAAQPAQRCRLGDWRLAAVRLSAARQR
jgi:hypothetical protein